MKRLGLLFIALALTACSTDSSLWGTYPTPTGQAPVALQVFTETLAPTAQIPPTQPDPPTATITASPDLVMPTLAPTQSKTPDPNSQPILYYAQSGDTLDTLAVRFGVDRQEITSPKDLPGTGLIDPGTLLIIPDLLETPTTSNIQILPDSEIIFSASATDFDTAGFISNAVGYLSEYHQWLGSTGDVTGAQGMIRATTENSVNPRLMLALLEYESGWVYGKPADMLREEYPMGYQVLKYKGLFMQMVWTVNQLFHGYYGWRTGTLTELTFPNGETLRLHPELNAGTVALQYFFSRNHNRADWERILNPNSDNGFPALYARMFGDPWARAQTVEPIFPPNLVQPDLVLPFEPNRQWSLTSGPHGAWEPSGPLAAIDLAPSSARSGCGMSDSWVLASAPGLVVRAENGVVMVDLDGDGNEQTGWNLLYMHIAAKERVDAGFWVRTNDPIGHASCEGGSSTGTHLHFARKYNGEWIIADGPLPFVLSNWIVHAGEKAYQGTMTRGARVVTADPVGQSWSIIIRLPNE